MFCGRLVFNDHFSRQIAVVVEDLIGGEVEELGHFLEFFDGKGALPFFNFTIGGLVHSNMGGDFDLFEAFFFADGFDVVGEVHGSKVAIKDTFGNMWKISKQISF